jgi:membrane protease YdiL (CAAX protease family)
MPQSISKKASAAILLSIAYCLVFIPLLIYRLYAPSVSIWIEELLIKGFLFTSPLLLLPLTKHQPLAAIGITATNLKSSLIAGLGIGLLLGFAGQFGSLLSQGMLTNPLTGLDPLLTLQFVAISFITAFFAQLLFSGYFYGQLRNRMSSPIYAILTTAFLFSILHIPALALLNQPLTQLLLQAGLLFSLGVSCVILYHRYTNLLAPVMAHAFWGIAIFLFR